MRGIPASMCVVAALCALAGCATTVDDSLYPIAPGEKGVRPFWNTHARRFIYPPAFDMPDVSGAGAYRFTVKGADETTHQFSSGKPTASLSSVWAKLPEGYATVVVEALDANNKVIGKSGERAFYRSPDFSGKAAPPIRPYRDAAREGLRAIFLAPHVQHWLKDGKPDRTYPRYCYPNKVMGALVRAMSAYSQVAESDSDRKAALQIARSVADHLISIEFPADARYANVPPTYSIDVDDPKPAVERFERRLLMVPSTVDAAFGFLDLYDVTKDSKYFSAAKAIADRLVMTQEADGTWPLLANWQTGAAAAPQRLVPTWVIFLFDRFAREYHVADFKSSRDRAWAWIEQNPLKTYQWDGQFEDVNPHPPYVNLAREQACDVAMLLLSEPRASQEKVAQARELLRFAEDQFVVWSAVKDPEGWNRAVAKQRSMKSQTWFTPCVLEQYVCYEPVARSSAVLINVYLKSYEVTRNPIDLEKAKALANGLLDAQAWLAKTHNGNGEFPTWVETSRVMNWLNNSYYAAEAVKNVAEAVSLDER